MPVDYKTIIDEFMEGVFGKTLGQRLFALAEQRENVSFGQLGPNKQFAFLQRMLYHIYNGFYTKSKIRTICMQLFFRFSRYEIAERVERTLKRSVKMDDIKLDFALLESRGDLDSYENMYQQLYIDISGPVNGGLLISLNKDDTKEICRMVMESNNMAYDSAAEPDQEIVKEFFNIILPGVIDIIASTFDEIISFLYTDREKFYDTYSEQGEGYVVEKIDSGFEWVIDNKPLSGKVCFLLKSSDPEMIEMMRNQQRRAKMSVFEQTPPKIMYEYSENVLGNMKRLFEFIFEQNSEFILNTTLSKIEMELVPHLPPFKANLFINYVINHYMANASENKLNFFRRNVENIFGVTGE